MEGLTEFLALMAVTVFSISVALLLEWLLLRGVFGALARYRAGGTQPPSLAQTCDAHPVDKVTPGGELGL